MQSLLTKLRDVVEKVSLIPSIQRLAEATDFLETFGPRSRYQNHLSFTDDAVAKMAKQGRESLVEAREVIANLAECLENDEAHPLPDGTIAKAKRLIETLVDVRKASTRIDGLHAKFEKSQTFNAAIDEATAALEKMSLGSVKTSLSQFACSAQRSFWSAECEKEVDSAVDAITSKLADFDLKRWQAAHDKAVAAEEAKRAEDHQRRLREVEIAEQKEKIKLEASREREREAAIKKRETASLALVPKVSLKEETSFEKMIRSYEEAQRCAQLENGFDLVLRKYQVEIDGALRACVKERDSYKSIYMRYQLCSRVVIVWLSCLVSPSVRLSDGACTMGSFTGYSLDIVLPAMISELILALLPSPMQSKLILQISKVTTSAEVFDFLHLMAIFCAYTLRTGDPWLKEPIQDDLADKLCPGNVYYEMVMLLNELCSEGSPRVGGIVAGLFLTALLVRVIAVGYLRDALKVLVYRKTLKLPPVIETRIIKRQNLLALKKALQTYPNTMDSTLKATLPTQVKDRLKEKLSAMTTDLSLRLDAIFSE